MTIVLIVAGAVVALVAVAVGDAVWASCAPEPGAFYDPPADLRPIPGR